MRTCVNPIHSLFQHKRPRPTTSIVTILTIALVGTTFAGCANAHRRQVYYPGFERPSDNWRTPGTVPVPPPRFND